jgi:hypothetical protein
MVEWKVTELRLKCKIKNKKKVLNLYIVSQLIDVLMGSAQCTGQSLLLCILPRDKQTYYCPVTFGTLFWGREKKKSKTLETLI